MENRRHDDATADIIRRALELQRDTGFDPAFKLLLAHGVDVELARTVLYPHYDRRAERMSEIRRVDPVKA